VPWRGLDALAVYALNLFLSVVAISALGVAAQADMLSARSARGLSLAVSGLGMGLLTLLYVRLRFPAGAGRLAGWRPWRLGDVGLGLGAGIGAWLGIVVAVGIVLQWFLGEDLPRVQPEFRELAADPALAPYFALGAVVVAPIAEELFFRGMLFQALRDRIGLWAGMTLSALLFAGAHVQIGGEAGANALIVAIIFPLGMLLAWLFQRRGSLLVPIVVHAVFNGVQVALLTLLPAT
jgi:uncharacterized protein